MPVPVYGTYFFMPVPVCGMSFFLLSALSSQPYAFYKYHVMNVYQIRDLLF
jgi:hypothetical protein